MADASVIRAATRQSPLALWQAEHVRGLLEATHEGLRVELVPMTSAPDTDLSRPISDIGGKGAFAKEVQRAVLDGRADIAIHSAKDLPSTTVEGLRLAAVPPRGDARDVLIGENLIDLKVGAVIATGSNRRRTQLAHLRPDLRFVELRGNIARRVSMVGTATETGDTITAVIAAGAALLRQDMESAISDWVPLHVMVPQVGQGALAIECRADDDVTAAGLAAIEDPASRRQIDAERGFLVALGGDCDLPAGAHAVLDPNDPLSGQIALHAVVASMDAARLERVVVRGTDPAGLGGDAMSRLPVSELLS